MNVHTIQLEMKLTNESMRKLATRVGVHHSTLIDWLDEKRDMPLGARLELWLVAKDYRDRRGFRAVKADLLDYFSALEIDAMNQVARQ